MSIILDGTSGITLPGTGTQAQIGSLTTGTAQTASGTAVNFTGIPSWVKKITVLATGLSYAAAGGAVLRIGSGSLASTGYLWTQQTASNNAVTVVGTENPGTHFGNFTTSSAAAIVFASFTLTLINSATNTWMSVGIASRPSDNIVQSQIGYASLPGALDQVSLVAITSTFDAGTVNILYE